MRIRHQIPAVLIALLPLLTGVRAAWAQPATSPAPTATTAPAATQPAAPAPPELRLRQVSKGLDAYIGSDHTDDASSPYKMRVDLNCIGAGIKQIRLADYKVAALSKVPYTIFSNREPLSSALPNIPDAFAAVGVSIDGVPVRLDKAGDESHRLPMKWALGDTDKGKAVFAATIEDDQGRAVLEIRRTYSLAPGSYDLLCAQEFINRTEPSRPLHIVFQQNLIADIAPDDVSARGSDGRHFNFGYYNLDYDPNRHYIYTDNTLAPRLSAYDAYETFEKDAANAGKPYCPVPPKLPKHELVWASQSNRYFTLVAHPLPQGAAAGAQPGTAPPGAGVPALCADDKQLALAVIGAKGPPDTRAAAITLTSQPIDLAPGETKSLDVALFAGPKDDTVLAQPLPKALCLDKLVIYSSGCFLSFQSLAEGLLWYLKVLRNYLTFDWGVAIIMLVLTVRLILHPLTRRSQISMAKFGKQQAAIKPELERLKARYKDDHQALQKAQMELYREKGISPVGMLGGCLPMLLQMPIWTSLYAMLLFAIELRHQHAFYGVFQAVSGGKWPFLADLSSPDNFIPFPTRWWFSVPILGEIHGINILPILMGVVFYLQQKLTAQPAVDEQARQQQKMMLVTTLIFPIMMYSTPCGLTLYIMASTAAGIVDSTIVKRHIKREEAAGTLFKSKPHKPGGIWDRLQKMAEHYQQQRPGDTGGGGRRRFKERD